MGLLNSWEYDLLNWWDISCLNDQWKRVPAVVRLAGNGSADLTITFLMDATNSSHKVSGSVVRRICALIDMNDGSLYTRVTTHPFFMAPHEWMRVVAGWLLRAAQIQFHGGKRHLMPGYPTHYNREWMRDGFNGIH